MAADDPKVKRFFKRLTLPTHPDFDFLRDSGALDYTPPAVLANYIVLYTNAAMELTEQVVHAQREIERLKQDKKETERALESLKRDLLASGDVPANATKNLMLTEAYVLRLAREQQRDRELDAFEGTVAGFDDAISTHKGNIESYKFTMTTIELACQNIQTHLSYVKKEAELGGRGGYGR